MMTRKDYVVVANILHDYKEEMDNVSFVDIVNDFGDYFEKDNPNFNWEKFREACYK
jgi:HD superfamily phosphohydrolase YqeK